MHLQQPTLRIPFVAKNKIYRWVLQIIVISLVAIYYRDIIDLVMSFLSFLHTMVEGYLDYKQSAGHP